MNLRRQADQSGGNRETCKTHPFGGVIGLDLLVGDDDGVFTTETVFARNADLPLPLDFDGLTAEDHGNLPCGFFAHCTRALALLTQFSRVRFLTHLGEDVDRFRLNIVFYPDMAFAEFRKTKLLRDFLNRHRVRKRAWVVGEDRH